MPRQRANAPGLAPKGSSMQEQTNKPNAAERVLEMIFEDRPDLAKMLGLVRYEMPRYRYFTGGDGHMYAWTTEKDHEGWFHALDYKPVGKGARSGKPEEWVRARSSKRRKRQDAKAIAVRWYEKSKTG